MTEQEKKALQRIWQACRILPSEKMEFLLGYAEGVIAGSASQGNDTNTAAAICLGVNQPQNTPTPVA